MKDIKEFINEAETIKASEIKYVMVSYYDARLNTKGYLFKNISEIKSRYSEWDFDEDEIKPIIDEVQKLKVNECYIHMLDESAFEVISRIK